MKKFKPIIVVAGEPNSIFFEIFFKALKYKKFRSPIIIIASIKLIRLQMKKMNIKKSVKITTDWYFRVLKGKEKARDVTFDQINKYMKKQRNKERNKEKKQRKKYLQS